jgi:hypothetical protein
MFEGRIYIACSCDSGSYGAEEVNEYIFASVDERAERTVAMCRDAYDSHLKCQFNLHVVYLWLTHDYLAYGKFVSWCVHGRLNCPACMDESDAFMLQRGRKVSFFDCHRRFLHLSYEF